MLFTAVVVKQIFETIKLVFTKYKPSMYVKHSQVALKK